MSIQWYTQRDLAQYFEDIQIFLGAMSGYMQEWADITKWFIILFLTRNRTSLGSIFVIFPIFLHKGIPREESQPVPLHWGHEHWPCVRWDKHCRNHPRQSWPYFGHPSYRPITKAVQSLPSCSKEVKARAYTAQVCTCSPPVGICMVLKHGTPATSLPLMGWSRYKKGSRFVTAVIYRNSTSSSSSVSSLKWELPPYSTVTCALHPFSIKSRINVWPSNSHHLFHQQHIGNIIIIWSMQSPQQPLIDVYKFSFFPRVIEDLNPPIHTCSEYQRNWKLQRSCSTSYQVNAASCGFEHTVDKMKQFLLTPTTLHFFLLLYIHCFLFHSLHHGTPMLASDFI